MQKKYIINFYVYKNFVESERGQRGQSNTVSLQRENRPYESGGRHGWSNTSRIACGFEITTG